MVAQLWLHKIENGENEETSKWVDKLVTIWGLGSVKSGRDIAQSIRNWEKPAAYKIVQKTFILVPLWVRFFLSIFYHKRSTLEIFFISKPSQRILSLSFLIWKYVEFHTSRDYYWYVYKNKTLWSKKKSIINDFIMCINEWKHQTKPLAQFWGSVLVASKKIWLYLCLSTTQFAQF